MIKKMIHDLAPLLSAMGFDEITHKLSICAYMLCQKHFIYDAILWELNIKKLRTKHSNIWFFLVIIKILTMNHPKICTNLKIYKKTIEITDVQK